MTGERKPDQRADTGGPPLGGGTPEGGVPDDSEPIDPGFGIDETGGTGKTPEQRAAEAFHRMDAALGGFVPHIMPGKQSREEYLARHHQAAREIRAKARSMPKKGRMVEGGREGRKVN